MQYTVTGRNIEITDSLRDALEKRLGKLDKYFAPDTEAKVTLSMQSNMQKIEVNVPTKLGLIRAEETGRDLYLSIEDACDNIIKQINRHKKKLIDKKQSALSFSEAFIQEELPAEDEAIRIDKVKTFALKPMDPEEACLQMEMLGHSFFMFLNSETNAVNVVYKRKGNSYGLIEPEA